MPNETQPDQPYTTRGQKLFNGGLYGVGYGLGNFVATIPLAHWCLHGGGAKYFEKGGKLLEKAGMPANIVREVREMAGTSAGGWAMLGPVWVAERFRKPAVDWLNQHFGSEKDKQTEIHHPPRQTVGSLLVGRAAAMGLVMVAFRAAGKFIPEQFEQFQKWCGKQLCHVLGKPELDAIGQESKTFRYGRMAALDVFATASATVLLYTISRAAAQNRDARRQHRAEVAQKRREGVDVLEGDVLPAVEHPAEGVALKPETKVAGEKEHAPMVAAPVLQEVAAVR